ncbi:MAG: PilN domain-containing protein [Phycisphaerae bacterium]|nr:PilN domain-containing protein [Phycisphaerae bacterium]
MASLNFVPDDYIQTTESRRINVLCVVLLLMVIGSLSTVFGAIKVRQHACAAQEVKVYATMNQMQQSLVQFEQLQIQRDQMMKSALTIADLLEFVPRSILLAQLTNALPKGASLTTVDIIQKDPGVRAASQAKSHYQATQAKPGTAKAVDESPEKRLITEVTLTGLAPSDLQVAAYIQRLEESRLMSHVELIQSKEHEVENEVLREFELKADLAKAVKLSPEDLKTIQGHNMASINRF